MLPLLVTPCYRAVLHDRFVDYFCIKFLSIFYWGRSMGESSIQQMELIRVTLTSFKTKQRCKNSPLSLYLLPKILQGKETVTVLNKLATNAWGQRQFHSSKSSEMHWSSCLIEVQAMSVFFFLEVITGAIHQQRDIFWIGFCILCWFLEISWHHEDARYVVCSCWGFLELVFFYSVLHMGKKDGKNNNFL